MKDETQEVRFLLGEDDTRAVHFVYKPPEPGETHLDQLSSISYKFSNRSVILDDLWLVGGTRWSRTLYRLRRPIAYSKRGLRKLYRRIKRLFVKPRRNTTWNQSNKKANYTARSET
jgi:hypothetical protein